MVGVSVAPKSTWEGRDPSPLLMPSIDILQLGGDDVLVFWRITGLTKSFKTTAHHKTLELGGIQPVWSISGIRTLRQQIYLEKEIWLQSTIWLGRQQAKWFTSEEVYGVNMERPAETCLTASFFSDLTRLQDYTLLITEVLHKLKHLWELDSVLMEHNAPLVITIQCLQDMKWRTTPMKYEVSNNSYTVQ